LTDKVVPVKAIDRVMNAYLKRRRLTGEQTARVRAELSGFIDDLMQGKIATEEPPVGPSKPGSK